MGESATIKSKISYHHGDLSKALVSAVRVLIERDGTAHFSISEACQMAGVSTAAPYRHFKDKQDILYHVAREGFDDLTAEMEVAIKTHKRGEAALIAAIGKAYVRFAETNPGVFRLMFGSSPNVKQNDQVRDTGHCCFNTLINEVAYFLGLDANDEASKKTSVLLWTFVHGVASLLIDEDYNVADIAIDIDAMIEVATPRLLGQ